MNTLKFKLFVIGGVALLVALLLVVVNIYSVNQGTQALATVYENQVKPAASLQSIDNLLKDVRFRMAAVLVDQMPVASSKKQVEEARQKVPEQWQQFKEKTKGNVFSAEAQKQIEKIDKQLLLLPEFLNKLSSAYADNDKNKIGSVLEDDWPLIQSGLLNPISTLVEFQQKSVNDTYQIGSAKGAQLIYVAIGSLLVSVVVTAGGVTLAGNTGTLTLNVTGGSNALDIGSAGSLLANTVIAKASRSARMALSTTVKSRCC